MTFYLECPPSILSYFCPPETHFKFYDNYTFFFIFSKHDHSAHFPVSVLHTLFFLLSEFPHAVSEWWGTLQNLALVN